LTKANEQLSAVPFPKTHSLHLEIKHRLTQWLEEGVAYDRTPLYCSHFTDTFQAPQNEDLDDDVNQTTEITGFGANSEGEEDAGSNQNTEQREQLARKLVRYALSCEYSRQPIRRADVATKVLGTSSKEFRAVFAEAQIMLRHTFGMEMVDQPKQDKVTVQQKRGT
jgi:hypothetical protein